MSDDTIETTDDEYEREHVVDNYARSKLVCPISDVVRAVDGVAEFASLVPHDEAWWTARNAQVDAELTRDAELKRIEERRKRAQLLKTDEHRFPAIAVDAATAVWPAVTAAMSHAARYVAGPRRVMVLAGGVGAGKSSAATWCALEVGGSSPAFLRASELESRGRYDKELRNWLRTRSMLVLDDLGAEVLDGRGVFRSLLDEVVDLFYGDRKRLVITTNLRARRERAEEEPQLFERYGDRVMSRLVEVGLWGDCGARDLRREVRR